jgi:O-antigen/teichoic acid export membrane protein
LKPKSNSNIYFDNSNTTKNLKKRTVKGGILTLSSQAIKFGLHLVSTVFLARLLTPEDYGIFGMVAVVLKFLNLFKDIGLSQATIQKSEITQAQVSNLFWINVLISFSIATLLFLFAPIIVSFYQEPRLLMVTKVLSISFFVSGLSLQHLALLKRQMLFEKIIFVDMGGQILGLTIAIIAAIQGLAYWSLVLMQVVPVFTTMIGIWYNCRWIPSLPSRNSGVKDMLNYGWNLTGFNILNFFSRNLDNILIGKFWGTQALGLYAKGYQLLLFPLQQINAPIANVALPALSRLQLEPEKYKRFYYKIVLLITTLGMPIVCFLFVDSHKIILFLLGEKWLDIVPIFRALTPGAFIDTLNIATGLVFTSLGRTDRQFKLGLFGASLQVILFVIAIRWGVLAIAWSFSLQSIIMFFPRFIYSYKGTCLNITTTLKTISHPVISSILSLASLILFQYFVSVHFLLELFIFIILYLSFWFLLPNGYNKFKSLIVLKI